MRTKLRLPSVPALTQTMTTALLAQLLRRISLARRAGVVVTGQGPVAQALKQGQGKLLLLAGDLSEGGRKKQEANAGRKQLQAVTLPLGGQRLGVCVGRDYAGIILIGADPFAEDLQRLSLQVKALGASLSPELQATVGVLPSL
jgi:ribosomal protein L7Ae-like RNA K-turn-binding protein